MSQKPPAIIADLIERFEQNAEAYRSTAYNETQVRQEFINLFFEALGWDIANKSGHAEAYKDVIHEDAIKVGAPDYCFRIGGARAHNQRGQVFHYHITPLSISHAPTRFC